MVEQPFKLALNEEYFKKLTANRAPNASFNQCVKREALRKEEDSKLDHWPASSTAL